MSDNQNADPKGELPVGQHPGHISMAFSDFSVSNCTVATFKSAEEMAAFFAERPGRRVAQVLYSTVVVPVEEQVSIGGMFTVRHTVEERILCIYAKVLDDEELAELQARGEAIEKYVVDAREKRRQEKEAAQVKEAELLRLANIGAKCEKDHEALKRELRRERKEKEK